MSDQFRPIFDDDDDDDRGGDGGAEEHEGAGRDTSEPEGRKLSPPSDGWDGELDRPSKARFLSLVAAVVVILLGAAFGVRAAINATSSGTPQAPVQPRTQRAEPPSSVRGLGDALARDEAARSAMSLDDDSQAAANVAAVAPTTVEPLTFEGSVSGTADDDADDVVTEEEMKRFKAEHRANTGDGDYASNTGAQQSQQAQQAATSARLPAMEVWGTDSGHSGQPGAASPSVPPAPLPFAAGLSDPRDDLDEGSSRNRVETPDDVKEAFAARSGSLDSHAVERPLGECEVTAGDAITVGNVDAINTDIPAKAAVLVEVVQDVYCGANRQHIAIPAGSTFTASANARVAYGDALIQLCMDQLKRPPSKGFPTGSLVPITGCWAAAEIDGTIGWAAEIDNHWPKIFGAITLSTVLSLGSSAAVGNQTGFAPTIAQGAAANAGQQINQAGNRIVSREMGVKPTLTREMLQTARVKVTSNQPLQPWVPRHKGRR